MTRDFSSVRPVVTLGRARPVATTVRPVAHTVSGVIGRGGGQASTRRPACSLGVVTRAKGASSLQGRRHVGRVKPLLVSAQASAGVAFDAGRDLSRAQCPCRLPPRRGVQ